MVRFADRLLITCCATLLWSLAAHAAPQLSMYLKNYYADYQIVEDCSNQAQLTAADAQTAKDAMAKIEAYYLHRDASIDKDRVLKQAVSNKNAAYKMRVCVSSMGTRQCIVCQGLARTNSKFGNTSGVPPPRSGPSGLSPAPNRQLLSRPHSKG